MRGRVEVVHGRVAVGNKSCTSPTKQLVELGSLVGQFGQSGRSS